MWFSFNNLQVSVLSILIENLRVILPTQIAQPCDEFQENYTTLV